MGQSAPRDLGKAPLPPGLRVATIGARIGAWVIDTLILLAFLVGFWALAVVFGAVIINPEAQRQLDASPVSLPTVAPYQTNLPLLGAMLSVFVVVNVAYAAICWTFFRGMPGQKLLSLQVGSAATGRNLGLGRALIRAVVALGIPLAAVAGVFYGALAFVSSVPWSEVTNPQPGGQADAWLNVWSGPLDMAMLLVVAWPPLLLILTATNPLGQGLHDRLSGSLVVGKGAAPSAAAYGRGFGPGLGMPGYGALPGTWSPPNSGSAAGDGPPGVGGLPPGSWPPEGMPPDAALPGDVQPDALPPGAPGVTAWLGPEDESDARPKIHAATVGRRVGAYLFDCGVVYLVFLIMESIAAMVFLHSITTAIDERTYILLGLAGGVWQLVYFTASWALWRGTLGQRVLHLRVSDATTGKALSWLDAVVRWAVLQGPFALATVVPVAARGPVLLMAPIWTIFLLYSTTNDPDSRGLHDRFLNSRVDVEI